MAVAEGGVDLRAADKAAKAEAAKNKKFKVWKAYTKKKPQHKDHGVGAKNLASGNHPLVAALERCGYHDIVFHHDSTGVAQAGSFRPAFGDQLTINAEDFDVRVPDETGFLLPPEHEECMQGCNNLTTLKTLREIAVDAEKRKACKKIAFDGYAWKVVKKLERTSDGGGIIAACAKKRKSIVKDNYFKLHDDGQGCDYWQLYDGPVAVDGKFSYKPLDVFDVEVGGEYHCINSKTEFDALGISSHSPFTTQEKWDEDARNCLGFPVKVTGHYDGGDGWDGYNVIVQAQHGEGVTYEAVIPIQCLRKEDAGDTLLLLGEVGQFIFKMELDLFANKGYNERGKQVQPLFAEFAGIVNNFCQDDKHYGDWDWVDHDDDDAEAEFSGLNPAIQAFIDGHIEAETDYADLGYALE